MAGEACLPSNVYYPRTPDYTLYFGVHVCWSEHSDSSFIYGFMSLDYGLGTMTATTVIHLIRLVNHDNRCHSSWISEYPKATDQYNCIAEKLCLSLVKTTTTKKKRYPSKALLVFQINVFFVCFFCFFLSVLQFSL